MAASTVLLRTPAFVLRRLAPTLVSAALVLSACADDGSAGPEVSEDDVVLAYVDQGVSAEVADCFVGLGQREFELDELLPGGATDAERALLDEMLSSCEEAVAILSADDPPPPDDEPIGPMDYGDDAYLDKLWVRCDGGDGRACDQLFRLAPIGSAYEQFGVTCGERSGILDCAEEMGVPVDLVVPDVR